MKEDYKIMSHKKFILPISFGILAMGVGALAANGVKVNAAPVDDWGALQAQTIEAVDNGVKLTNTSGFGQRAYFKDKVLVDGLSFDWKINEFVQGECRGFSFHNGSDPWSYFTETGSAVFAYWGVFGQNRLYVMPNHDYNNNATTTLAVNAKGGETKDMSSAGGLVCNSTSSFTLNFKFEKDGDDWYKVTITGSQVWGDPNYNVTTGTAGNSAVTYISKENMHVDEYGRAYMITMAMEKKATDDSVEFLNMECMSGIKLEAPTKLSYKKGEELDLTGMKVTEAWKIKEGADVTDKVTVSGYDKDTYGKQTVTVSYLGYSQSFEVEVVNPVVKIELVGEGKTSYKYGEELDLTGYKVKRTYENGDVDEIELTTEMVSGYDKNQVGKQNVAISANGVMTQLEVEVKDYITGIKVLTAPTKVEYLIGEELDVNGGKLEVTYASGAKKTVEMTKDMVKDFDSSEAGEITVTISYEEFSTTLDLTINKPAPEPTPDVEPEPETKSNGCGVSVVAFSATISLLALAGIALVGYKKRH